MEKEIREEEFDCEKASSIVTVTHEIAIHRDAVTRKVDRETPVQFECSHADACGVGKSSGFSTTYNWDECIYKK